MSDDLVDEFVTLIKKNGQKYSGLQAAVRPKMIFIPDGTAPIEEGDRLTRRLPNGLEETYLIKERGYCPKTTLLPAHYQVKVEREGGAPQSLPDGSVLPTDGPGPGTLQAGEGISRQLALLTTREMLQELRKAIITNLAKEDYSRWISVVDTMEKSQDSPEYTSAYKQFILLAADHLSWVAPFIPSLTKLLRT